MLRGANPQDANAVASVLIESRKAFLSFAPSAHTEADVRNWVEHTLIPTNQVVVFESSEMVVGVLAVFKEKAKSWVDQLYVLPGWTGHGIGSRLLNYAQAILPSPIHLYTFQENVGARRFYERKGYTAVEFSDGRGNEERCPDVLMVWPKPESVAAPD
jgi:GNAT superfamily N-acetyltransferase